jgi:hypothetical protein
MFDFDSLHAAMDELGFEGVLHVSRYLAASYGEDNVGHYDEEFARACLSRLTAEQRTTLVGYLGGFVVPGYKKAEIDTSFAPHPDPDEAALANCWG